MLGDTDLRALTPVQAHRLRGKRISMIFQDPQTSLAVVRQMSDDIAVLKDGRLVETGPSEAFFACPNVSYSRDLLSETPTVRFDASAA